MKRRQSPILIFSREKNIIYLFEKISCRVVFAFPAHNRTEKPNGDPLTLGSWGPAPGGVLTLSPPDFISDDFRKEFYRAHFSFYAVVHGESYVQEWDEFEQSEMGRARFALGSPDAPEGSADRIAWDREILIHAGRPFETLTKGCIRMDNGDIEQLAYEWIKWYRMGYPLDVLEILS